MYGDQYGGFVCGYWGSKGYGSTLNGPYHGCQVPFVDNANYAALFKDLNLTLQLPIVSNVSFLLTISIQCRD